MKKVVRSVLFVVFAVLFVFSGYQIFQYQRQNHQSRQTYEALRAAVKLLPDRDSSPKAATVQSANTTEEGPSEYLCPEVDFDALEAINPQIVGWLYCEGTDISYPVVQGSDNDYYLAHLFDGTYNPNGCLFLDSRVPGDYTGVHSIIYGHHRKNDTMFSALMGYKDQTYYDTHPKMLLVTRNACFVVELFSGYVADTEENAWDIAFSDNASLLSWLDQIMERSDFQSPVRPTTQDHILTLSTCSYEFEDARFVVTGVLRCLSQQQNGT